MVEYPKSVYEAVEIVAEGLFTLLGVHPTKDNILQLQAEYEAAYIEAGFPKGDTTEGRIEWIINTQFAIEEENNDQQIQ